MARAGDTIENPLSGERITFQETGAETGGRYLAAEIRLAPHGVGPPRHVHPRIEERFRVVSGTLSALVGDREQRYGPGEEFTVPRGTPHRWWNDTPEEVVIAARVSPALPLDRFLENVFAMVQMGYSNARGMPGPLRLSRVLPRFWDVLHLASPPFPVQNATMATLGVAARVLGFPSEYPHSYDRTRTRSTPWRRGDSSSSGPAA